jgi:hypothetical protein
MCANASVDSHNKSSVTAKHARRDVMGLGVARFFAKEAVVNIKLRIDLRIRFRSSGH